MEKQIPLYSIELNGFQMRYTLTENELSSNIKHSNILELHYLVEDKAFTYISVFNLNNAQNIAI